VPHDKQSINTNVLWGQPGKPSALGTTSLATAPSGYSWTSSSA